jgi:hypothetical protein
VVAEQQEKPAAARQSWVPAAQRVAGIFAVPVVAKCNHSRY